MTVSYDTQISLYTEEPLMQLGNLENLFKYLFESSITPPEGKYLDLGCGIRGFHSINISLRSGITQTMLEYYDESHDLCGMSPQAAGHEIISRYDTYQSRN